MLFLKLSSFVLSALLNTLTVLFVPSKVRVNTPCVELSAKVVLFGFCPASKTLLEPTISASRILSFWILIFALPGALPSLKLASFPLSVESNTSTSSTFPPFILNLQRPCSESSTFSNLFASEGGFVPPISP